MNPQISIIIATFNAEKTLTTALNSILTQNFQNWECIIIDGASKDHTIPIVKEFQKRDSRFRFISEPDKGIYDAFNKGWKIAKGEWIYYLGADDQLTTEGLKCLIKNVDPDTDIIYGNYITEDYNAKKKTRIAAPPHVLKKCMCCSHQAVIMKRTCIDHLNGFNIDYSILGDFDLMQRAYLKGYRFKQTNVIVSIFKLGGMSYDNINIEYERYKILKRNKSITFPITTCVLLTIKKILVILKHNIERKFQ